MKKIVVGLIIGLLLALASCAAIGTGPQNKEEVFPFRNQDPRVGLIVNEGTAHLNVFLYDEAGRLIEQIYIAGVNRYLKINGQNIPQYWARRLEAGQYRTEIFPFYYKTEITNPLFGKPGRYRIDLPKQTNYVYVDRDAGDYYYGGRHWGWVLYLNCGDISDTAHGLPGAKINFQGEAWELLFGK